MEFIENYKGVNIYKFNGYFTTGVDGGDISDINFLKIIIDIKNK